MPGPFRKTSEDGVPLVAMSRQFKMGLRRYLYGVGTVIFVFLLYRFLSRGSEGDVRMGYKGEVMSRPSVNGFNDGRTVPGNVVRLDVYMEAQCPDTSRFVRAQLMPAWKKLSQTGRVDWNLIPFGKARCVEREDGDFDCTCQHGPNECILNQLMNCVIETIQHPDRYMETIECIQGKPNLDAALEKCIAPSDNLSINQMQQCASSSHGRKLLALAGAKTASLSPRMTFVPWIMLNGERVVDALYDLPGNLCKQLEPAPVACS
ncbi:hypothetical protein PENTCL1PPCAC_5041 [Pristionchus entomophagus]|uniref:Gamma interferon inducible lysosomal thiol reductase n=1 Tax=Pristionchus entomophagus TaxID=358040 RepID=A0AAV5STK9_9BILA|nr:hypothetical protein PENTCL1PPCAC_5041 [Pristionchus entomophagus]